MLNFVLGMFFGACCLAVLELWIFIDWDRKTESLNRKSRTENQS